MDLLRMKIARMEKELADLANKNAALQACITRPSHSKTVPPEEEKAHNSLIGSQRRKDTVPNQNHYVPFYLFSYTQPSEREREREREREGISFEVLHLKFAKLLHCGMDA